MTCFYILVGRGICNVLYMEQCIVCDCIGLVYAHSCASEFFIISQFGLVGK